MKTITFCWLGYKGDSPLLHESFRSVRRAISRSKSLNAKFVLIDDAWAPVAPEVRKEFEDCDDASRIVTTYRRTPMLLGGKNLLGQLKAFNEAVNLTGPDVFVKIDCDALLFDADWLEDFAHDDTKDLAGVFDIGNDLHNSVFGFMYAAKAKWVPKVLSDVELFPAHQQCWEDYEFSSRIYRMIGADDDRFTRFKPDASDKMVVVPLEQVNDTFVNARATTFAWNYQTQKPSDKEAFRAKVGEWMKRLNDLREQKDQETEQKP